MKTSIAVLVLLVVAAGTVYTQTPPALPQASELRLEPPSAPGLPTVPQQSQPSQPKERTIEQLLDEIEQVRAQKAELEKKEQALVAEARKRLDKQTERLNRLGLGAPTLPAPAVGFGSPALAPPGVGAPVAPTLPSPNGK